jgi:DNA polymerase
MQSTQLSKLILDYETYFDKDVSLKKLSYTDYVNHPDFFVWGASLLWMDQPNAAPLFYNFVELPDVLASIDWSQVEMICHNTHFDGYVLHRKYGHHPARYSCTMSMSRAIMQGATKNSLDALGQHFNLGRKLGFLNVTKGKKHLTPMEWGMVADGCNNDVVITKGLYEIFAPQLPEKEHRIIHLTQRMFCIPLLQVDPETAKLALDEDQAEQDAIIEATGLTKEQLSKDGLFAEALRNAGIEPPMKPGKPNKDGTPREIFAFAKTDQAFLDLIEGSDPVAAALCSARQAVQSTIGITRAQRLLNEAARGELPACYLYAGAHTWRWSGGNKMNLQNLKRGGKLRLSITAPPGYVLCVRDSSQIEVRTLYRLVGQEDGLAIFAEGRDPYIEMAEFIFQEKIEVAPDENGELKPVTARGKILRFIGKCVVLGCGYQMGPPKFQYSLSIGAIGGMKYEITLEEAQTAVWGYRNKNDRVQMGWEEGKALLTHLCQGRGTYHSWLEGVYADADTGRLHIPGGTWFQYPGLHWDTTERQFKYWTVRGPRKIYGGKVIENITQGVARNIIADQTLEIDEIAPVVMLTHDEDVACAPEDRADEVMASMERIMGTAPVWLPGIPLASSGGYARNYSK